jgi:magnesium and cobalt exporter, CNNM family
MDVASTVVLLALGLAASGFFSATETALTALPLSRVAALSERAGVLNRRAWRRWRLRPHRVLVTILVGNSALNVGVSALATQLAIEIFGDTGVGIAVGVTTLAVLIFAEVTPKTLARANPEGMARQAIGVIGALDFLLAPLTLALLGLSQLAARWRRVSLAHAPLATSQEDIRFLLSLSHQEGHLTELQHGMVDAVLRIERAVVRGVQVPRTDVTFLPDTLSLDEVRAAVLAHGYSRYPVYHERDDNIVGMLLAKDLLRPRTRDGSWLAFLQAPLYVPESKRIVDLLREMRDRRTHIALSVDEYGNIAGLVTLEDILELIVGDIEDEFDTAAPRWTRESSGSLLVRGSLPLEHLARLTGVPMAGAWDYTSVAGLVLARAGRVPAAGTKLKEGRLLLEVVDATPTRIQRVRVTIQSDQPPQA